MVIENTTTYLPQGGVWDWLRGHVHTMDATGGIKRFPDYGFLKRIVESLEKDRILIVAKSRQMLATWTICGWMIHRALYGDPGLFLLLSKGARDTSELIKRLKVVVQHLPEKEQTMLKVKAAEIESATGSRILALPATEDAVRMHSPAGVFWDEMAFTPHSEAIWTAVKPAIDSGGAFCGISTPNGTDNVFYSLYNDVSNGFGKLKIHWKEHPRRDENWEKEARRGLSDARWKQEYEVDFDVLADRVYDEFEPELHLLNRNFRWQAGTGMTFRGIDFGYRHPYVIWAQLLVDGTLIMFDEWEGFDATIEELADAIERIDARHGISESAVAWTACDPAGAAASDAGISSVERLKRRGFKLVWRNSQILTGVELVKSMLKDAAGRVRMKFSPNAERTLGHLRHYRWDKASAMPYKDNIHDHAMDTLRYLVINLSTKSNSGWTGAQVAGGKWSRRI